MKKLFAFISVFLLLSASIFAEVTAKKTSDGKIEATFFYGNPRASEVLLAGDFTNWQDGALPMEKTDKGFTLTKVFDAGTTVKYKFISDGNWTTDLRAPEFVDDGFGGKNSLAELDDLAGGDSSGNANAGNLGEVGKANLKFMSWTHVGLETLLTLAKDEGKDFNKGDVEGVGVALKSYLKVGGTVLPKVPVYIELALAEKDWGSDNSGKHSDLNLYRNEDVVGKDKGLEFGDGIKNFAVDTIFDPVYYYGGETAANTYLGHLKYGMETPIVNWTTGYKYAKLSPHQNVNWNTIDQEWEAGYAEVGGFSIFDFSPAFRLIPALADNGVEVELILAPNRSADRAGNRYGFYGIGDVKFATGDFSHYVDFQFNAAYGTEYDEIYPDKTMENDYIIGYRGIFGPVTLNANYLLNRYGSIDNGDGTKSYFSPATSDVGLVNDDPEAATENMAANVNATFTHDIFNVNVGYRFRGDQANLMYVEEGADNHTDISDQLGDVNTFRVFGNVGVTPVAGLDIGLDAYMEGIFDTDEDNADLSFKFSNKDTKELYFRPSVGVALAEFTDLNATIDAYGKLYYITEEDDKYYRGSDDTQFLVKDAGLRFAMNLDNDVLSNFSVTYNFDNRNESVLFNTVAATAEFKAGYNVQAGIGIRSANKDVDEDYIENPVGFFLGAYKKLSKKTLWGATAFCQFMYAMDPYNALNDGPELFDLDDDSYAFGKDSQTYWGVTDFAENAAFRIGLGWDL